MQNSEAAAVLLYQPIQWDLNSLLMPKHFILFQ